jgi:D-3-phosphoglycerate dehydrogenase / 2-oxoglutarate reductase
MMAQKNDKLRVLVAGKVHDAGINLLKERANIAIDLVESTDAVAYHPFLPVADAILLRTQPMSVAEVAQAPKLKIVSRHGVGFDAVDVEALSARKIALTIVGDVNSRAVAEHTMMLMLSAARRTVTHHIAATQGNWNERNRFDAVELDGKTLLVLGFGRIGRRVAELAQAFCMSVSAYDPHVDASEMTARNVSHAPSVAAALATADVLSVHMPGGKEPTIGAAELAMMKPSAVIVNAARGGVIDERALDTALRERRLRAAALDVLEQEPPAKDHPLLSNPFVTISPHNAGLTEECARRMSLSAARNILDAFDGKLDPQLVVNAKAIGLIG